MKKETRAEAAVAALLKQAGIRYFAQKGFIAGDNFCIADFYLPRPYRIVIEVDGPYHALPSQVARDKNKDAYYKGRGLRVFRLSNGRAMSMTKEELLGIINKMKMAKRHLK